MAISVTLDKAVYVPGDQMTLTVVCAPADRDRFVETPFSVLVSVLGGGTGEATASLRQQVGDAPVTITDPDRTWVVESDDGVTLVATATA